MPVIEGSIRFIKLNSTDMYQGRDTGKHTVTMVNLTPDQVEELESNGVKVKTYGEGQYKSFQRNFTTTADRRKNLLIIDSEGNDFTDDIPEGSTVRIDYRYGTPWADKGVPVYLNAIRVLDTETVPSVDPAL